MTEGGRPAADATDPAAAEGASIDSGTDAELVRCRSEIERLDHQLVAILAERIELARAVGRAKHAAGLPTLDPAREAAVLRRASLLAREVGLAEEDVREIFWHVMAMARRAQLADE